MIRSYILLIITLTFLSSCKQKEKYSDFDKVDLVVYYWKYGNHYYDSHELRGKLFATVDSSGKCKMIENYNGINHFKEFQISNTLLKQLTDSLSLLKNDLDLHPPYDRPIIYDGPNIRLVYYSKGVKKTIDFLDSENYSEYNSLLLYNHLNELNKRPVYKIFSDTAEIKSLRMKQLESIYDRFYTFINRADSNTCIIRKPRLIK